MYVVPVKAHSRIDYCRVWTVHSCFQNNKSTISKPTHSMASISSSSSSSCSYSSTSSCKSTEVSPTAACSLLLMVRLSWLLQDHSRDGCSRYFSITCTHRAPDIYRSRNEVIEIRATRSPDRDHNLNSPTASSHNFHNSVFTSSFTRTVGGERSTFAGRPAMPRLGPNKSPLSILGSMMHFS